MPAVSIALRQLARRLADAELGAEIAGDVETLAQLPACAGAWTRPVRRAGAVGQELDGNRFERARRRSRPSRRSAPRRRRRCRGSAGADRRGRGRGSRGSATRASDRPRPASSARRGTRRGLASSNGPGGSGPRPCSAAMRRAPIEAPHPRRERHARRQRAPAVRRPAVGVDARRLEAGQVLPAELRERRALAEQHARPLALMLAEQPGPARVEAAEVEEPQRHAVDEVAGRRR